MYRREQLIGSWFSSKQQTNGETHNELAKIHSDGCYEFTFTVFDQENQPMQEYIEVGDWGLVGDVHFTIAKAEVDQQEAFPMDMANPDNYHAYQVIQLDSHIFKYQHIVTKEVFILKRVVDRIAHC
ncbi:hypothetical protein Q4489_17425 [Thalassotalea sp. 1_MG-2023]|uniref:hypothetical protein n=1 Tax=Thalassotalea sp. 1_MG-2023 TaxID=3062680 RepID=UPI0026E42805|nr:hypothetical protein [Thalassotalea sp. 1_MG-2023]MDO6428793.1 hypothetical protein [Thalassotalea sp. 1_MG-2023]